MRRLVTLLAAAAVCGAAGCEPAPKVPFNPPPDAQPPQPDARPRPPRDMWVVDMAVRDAWVPDAALPDADLDEGVIDLDATASDADASDAEVEDALQPDVGAPDDRPERRRTVVLTGRTDAYIVWVQAGRLFVSRMAGPQEQPDPPLELGPAPATRRLEGGRTRTGPPWVLLTDGPEGMVQAYDVSADEPVGLPLELYAPIRVIEREQEVLVVGLLSPRDETRIGWRVLTSAADGAGPLNITATGMPLPVAIGRGLSRYVFAFDDGVCRHLTPAEDDHWLCGARPDAVLMGDGSGSNLYFAGNVGTDVRLWTGMPGAVRGPSVADSVVLAANAELIEQRQRLLQEVVIHVREPAGDGLYVLQEQRTLRIGLDDPDAMLGLVHWSGNWRLIEWPEEAEGPQAREVNPIETAAPPRAVKPPGCNFPVVLPEACDEVDRNCDGRNLGGLCCVAANGALHTQGVLPFQVIPAADEWHLGGGEETVSVVLRVMDQVRWYWIALRSREQDPMEPAAVIDGVASLREAGDGVGGVAVWITRPAESDGALEGQELHWLAAEGEGAQWVMPCEDAKGMQVLDTGRVRIFCSDAAFDHDPQEGGVTGLAYPGPEEEPVRWMTQGPGSGRWLVARGPQWRLQSWSVLPDGAVVGVEEEGLTEIREAAPGERALPFQRPLSPDGLPARVRDGRHVERWVSGLGWRVAPSSSWPVRARLSRHLPMAVSVGSLEDPALVNVNSREVALFTHYLVEGVSPWGVRPRTHRGRWPANAERGHAVAEQDTGEAGVHLMRAFGQQQIALDGYRVECSPPP